MEVKPTELVNALGEYGGILGIIVAALLVIIVLNMYFAISVSLDSTTACWKQ